MFEEVWMLGYWTNPEHNEYFVKGYCRSEEAAKQALSAPETRLSEEEKRLLDEGQWFLCCHRTGPTVIDRPLEGYTLDSLGASTTQ